MSKLSFYGKCASCFLSSAALMAVFFTAMIQGILIQLQGKLLSALGLYIIAWICLGTSVMLFNRGLRLSKLASSFV